MTAELLWVSLSSNRVGRFKNAKLGNGKKVATVSGFMGKDLAGSALCIRRHIAFKLTRKSAANAIVSRLGNAVNQRDDVLCEASAKQAICTVLLSLGNIRQINHLLNSKRRAR